MFDFGSVVKLGGKQQWQWLRCRVQPFQEEEAAVAAAVSKQSKAWHQCGVCQSVLA